MREDVVNLFQSFRRILCLCPCCGNVVRLSDLRLTYKGAAPRTWLDTYELRLRRLERKEALFDEQEEKLRKAAVERGRARVPKLVRRCMDKDISSFRFNPYDIKALLHPVDFVVFKGLNEKDRIENIAFLARKSSNDVLNRIRDSLKSSIDREEYDFRIARVTIEGDVRLESG